MNGEHPGPSRVNYVIAVAVILAGAAIFVVLLLHGLGGLTKDLTQVVVPGRSEVRLDAAGKYTIYHEHESVVGNRMYSTAGGLQGLECRLTEKETGRSVPLSPASVHSTYRLSGRAGTSAFEFRIEKPGTYVLSASYAKGEEGPEAVLAVGRNFVKRLLITIFGSISALLGSMAVAAVIIAVTATKRAAARRRAASGARNDFRGR